MIRNETARLLRRTAPALATLPLALALSGCGTLTGLNAENDFSCPMTPGVSCRSLSDTYEDSVRGRTPDRIELEIQRLVVAKPHGTEKSGQTVRIFDRQCFEDCILTHDPFQIPEHSPRRKDWALLVEIIFCRHGRRRYPGCTQAIC